MYQDPKTYMVIRLLNPLLIPGCNGYLISTVLLACFTYSGMWRLFLVFCEHYPLKYKSFAFAILYFPSVIFWGGGILKDPITLSCTGWVIYCIHKVFFIKKNTFKYSTLLLVNLYLIISIKPYIVFCLLPGSLMWIFSKRIYAVKNSAFKVLIVPIILAISAFGGYGILKVLQGYMGKFSVETITHTAYVTQADLKKDYYHGHSFDLGLEDESAGSFVRTIPAALVVGIYRPWIWECPNAVMLLSGLENTLILVLSIISIYRSGLFPVLSRIFKEPLLFFAITYSIFFAIMVGITSANFGALVRFKIAYLPFFICALFILIKKRKEKGTDLALASDY
jgi:hypothetical protein